MQVQGGTDSAEGVDDPVAMLGRGIYFDGVDDFLLIADSIMLNLSFTI